MRVDWHPDGVRLLTVHAGTLRTHVDGTVTAIAERTLDARWRADGRIAAVDGDGDLVVDNVGAPSFLTRIPVEAGALSGDGTVHAACTTGQVRAGDWTFGLGYAYGVNPDGPCSLALAHDGTVLAIGYETRAWDDGRWRRASGRGWLLLDLSLVPRSHARNPIPAVLDRAYAECVRDPGPMHFAFDGGRRVAIAAPEREPGIGVLRIGAGDVYPRRHVGGARAVALDDRGILAAYAYPDGVGERRLRVDYLAPERKGPAVVEIRDTLWIDPDLDDIVAVAFDPTSRKIAVLGAGGSVEIVPVP